MIYDDYHNEGGNPVSLLPQL